MLSSFSVNKLAIFCLLLCFTARVIAQNNDGDNSTGCGNGALEGLSGNNSSNHLDCGSSSSSSSGNLSHGDIGGIVVGVVVPVALFVLGYLNWNKIKRWYRRRKGASSDQTSILPTTQNGTSTNPPVAQV